MRLFSLLVATSIFCSAPAFAGVTIHFRGSAVDDASIDKIAEVACSVAHKHSWECSPVIGEEIAQLDSITARSISELENSTELGKVRGVVVLMHEMSEPLYLVFGPSRRIDNFVKTQFAGADVHVHAIELLQAVKPYFATLEVLDEGGYWETKSRAKLEQELMAVQTMMANIQSKRADVRGPVKRPDGRILDLLGK